MRSIARANLIVQLLAYCRASRHCPTERPIESAFAHSPDQGLSRFFRPRFDPGSLAGGVIGFTGFFAFASLSLSFSKFDTALASVWLPNALAVAFLLRARLPSDSLFLLGVLTASVLANVGAGTALPVALVFSVANLVDIVLIVWLTRIGTKGEPDMSELSELSRFVLVGGLIGPGVSAAIAATAMGTSLASVWAGATAWMLTDSVGMILIVPTVLLVLDRLREGVLLRHKRSWERAAVLGGGVACAYLVFRQDIYPLLFLIPPITLFHAFRLGSFGTAVYVAGLAVVASLMTWAGYGPIAKVTSSPTIEVHLIQAFIAANFLTGLPIAAILAAKERIMNEVETGKRELDLLADNITDAVLRYDASGKCIYASPSIEDVLGEPAEVFLGKSPTDRMHEEARETIQRATHRLLSGETLKERLIYRRFLDAPDGSPVYIEADCAVAMHPETGKLETIVVSARDVTARKELEQLLIRARQEAEEATRAKTEFLANMSHEIRTPMNGVLGFAELMLQSDLSEDQRRQAQMIVQSGRSMMMLLNDVLDLSKIEAGQIAIESEPVDLETMLHDCMTLYRSNAKTKGLELRLECDDWDNVIAGENGRAQGDETHWIMTDGLRLRQIILNLIGNAIKFTQRGFVIVSYRVVEGRMTVRIMDTGIGISEKRMESIFEPFTQAESDTARRFGGTGLGLTICRQLAELLGGYIEADSQPGVGSCFTLVLPAPAAKPAVVNDVEPQPVDLEALPERARILLAEDHDVNRMLITEMLEKCGQSVAIAHDGNEAIAMVMDSIVRDKPYDLVLMDVQMPGCDGYAATRAIRAEGIEADQLPIVALTANAFPEDIEAAHQAGMQAHLAKPLEFARLARTLQRWLPTTIVDEETSPRLAPDETPVIAFRVGAGDTAGHTPDLIARWEQRRSDALEAIGSALDKRMTCNTDWPAAEREQLAQCVHKLAGSAAMFGEEALGEKAAELECALRDNSGGQEPARLARELLALAAEVESESLRAAG